MKFNIRLNNNKYNIYVIDHNGEYHRDIDVSKVICENIIHYQSQLLLFNGVAIQDFTIFINIEDAKNALEWVESVYMMNKITNKQNIPYIVLQQGNNVMRLIGNPSKIKMHWDFNDNKVNKIVCSETKSCHFCNSNNKVYTRYQMTVEQEKTIGILECGINLFDSISQLILQHGDPSRYSVNIMRESSGLNTVYKVIKV